MLALATFWGRGILYLLFGVLGLGTDPLRCESVGYRETYSGKDDMINTLRRIN